MEVRTSDPLEQGVKIKTTMNFLIILWIAFLFSGGHISKLIDKHKAEIKDVESSPVPEASAAPSNVPSQSPQKSVKGANIEIKVVTPTNNSSLSGDLINYFKYPNAKSVNSSENKLTLESSDDSRVITDWYKEKINSKGMNVKSFVTTSANDNVENKLVAANSDFKVTVTIKGVKGGSFTISVETSKD